MRYVVLAGLAVLAGCGYVGDPQPPALNIPQPVLDLRAVQRGDRIVIDFTAPQLTVEKLPLKDLASVDVRVGPPPKEFTVESWMAGSDLYEGKPGGDGAVRVMAPVEKWLGKEVTIGTQTLTRRGRRSTWSNFITLKIVPALGKPVDWTVEGTEAGVKVSWRGAEKARVFRRGDGEADFRYVGEGAASWVDAAAEVGKSYEYKVQFAEFGGEREAESELSEARRMAYTDSFPPSAPGGLEGIAGLSAIELSWDRVDAADLAGYLVYRAEGDGAFARLGEPVTVTSLRDARATSGKKYRYRVTALDKTGNESAPSIEIEVTAP